MTSFKDFDCAKIMNYPERNVENIIFHQKNIRYTHITCKFNHSLWHIRQPLWDGCTPSGRVRGQGTGTVKILPFYEDTFVGR